MQEPIIRASDTQLTVLASTKLSETTPTEQLPTYIERGVFLDSVFDAGNAHVSRSEATRFVIHRNQIDQLKDAITREDLDAVASAIKDGHPNLQVIVYRMYAPGLFSEEYKNFIGQERCKAVTEEVEKIQEALKKYVWFTQRSENPLQVPTDFEELRKFALLMEHIADRLESLIPPAIFARYVADTHRQCHALLEKNPLSKDANYWRQLISETSIGAARYQQRLESNQGADLSQAQLPKTLQLLDIFT